MCIVCLYHGVADQVVVCLEDAVVPVVAIPPWPLSDLPIICNKDDIKVKLFSEVYVTRLWLRF